MSIYLEGVDGCDSDEVVGLRVEEFLEFNEETLLEPGVTVEAEDLADAVDGGEPNVVDLVLKSVGDDRL